jgi:hypothetical protein
VRVHNSPASLFPAHVRDAQTVSSEAYRRLQQFETGRGFRTLLGPLQAERRYLELTGNTGKFLDTTFTNIIVLIPLADRGLPGLSRQMLPFLLRLNFRSEFNLAKPWATHLQAFRPDGLPFQYVGQIHTALLKLVEILDIIRTVPGSPRSSFFMTLFGPVLSLLRVGGTNSLARLPVARVLTTVSNLLLDIGALANNLKADTWTTDEAQRAGLAPCLVLDVRDIINQATLDLFQNKSLKPPKPTLASSKGVSKSFAFGTVKPPQVGRGTVVFTSKAAAFTPKDTTTSSSTTHPINAPTALCILALLEKYKNINVGCRRSECPYRHDLQKASKEEEFRLSASSPR